MTPGNSEIPISKRNILFGQLFSEIENLTILPIKPIEGLIVFNIAINKLEEKLIFLITKCLK